MTRLRGIDIESAREAIRDLVIRTPVIDCDELSERAGVPVLLKLESLQVTGSFKVRGAANRILALDEDERARGVVACSSGNHGRAVAYVAERLGIPAVVCVPEWVDPVKLAAIRRHGAETILHGKTYDEAEARSLEIMRERGLAYVHPFDDPHVIAGQGTIGLELLEQVPDLRAVVAPLSGGGLIAGIAHALKTVRADLEVIGVSAANARVMYESLRAGRPLGLPEGPTLANALSGGIGLENRHTLRLVRELVDRHVLVDEDEIGGAMTFAAVEHKLVVEGGGAVGIAAVLAGRVRELDGPLAVVVSGGNVEPGVIARVAARYV